MGWLSPLQPALQSENSPLGSSGPPLTDEEISWIGSMPSITLTLSVPLFGYCLDRYGRKMTALISTAPNIITYLLLIFADNVYIVYAARLIGGFCSSGAFVVAPIYINETSEPHLRGFLGGLSGSFIKLGVIIAFVLGGYTSYLTLNLVSISFTVIFMIFYVWLPESPVYLISQNRKEEARQVLEKIRGSDTKLIESEISKVEKIIKETKQSSGKYSWKQFFTTRATLTGMFIVSGVFSVQMLSGYPAVVRYTVDIFQDSGTSFSPYLAAIILAVAQFLTALVGAAVLDKVGRKSLLLICTVIMAVSITALSVYLHLKNIDEYEPYVKNLKILPTIALTIYISGYATGYGSVPFVIVPEMFSPEARGTAAMVTSFWCSVMEFVVVKMFPTVTSWIGLAGSISIFSCTCCVGIVFLYFLMFETKGLEFDEIYSRLSGKTKSQPSRISKILKPFLKNRKSVSSYEP